MSHKEDYEQMSEGIQQLLGKKPYDPPERVRSCTHRSDGFVYEQTSMWTTLRCTTCGELYDVNDYGTQVQI